MSVIKVLVMWSEPLRPPPRRPPSPASPAPALARAGLGALVCAKGVSLPRFGCLFLALSLRLWDISCLLFASSSFCLSACHCLYHYLLSLSLSRFSLFFVGLFLSVRFSCSIFQYLKPPEAQILQAGTIPKFTKVPTKYYFSFFNIPLHFSPPSVNRWPYLRFFPRRLKKGTRVRRKKYKQIVPVLSAIQRPDMLGSTQGKHSVSNSISSFGIGAPVTGSGSLVYFLWRGESGLQSPVDILDPFHSATITRAGRPSTVYRKGGHFSFFFFFFFYI